MEFPLIYKQTSKPLAIGLFNDEEPDFMKVMIIPELEKIVINLKSIEKS